MPELGIAYEITGPDGTRAVVGNGDAATGDPDFIGYLDDDGVSFNRDHRTSSDPLTEDDGQHLGPTYTSGLTLALKGMINPNAGDVGAMNALEQKLKRASAALRADAEIRWTPTGDVERLIWARRVQDVAIAGRRPKTYQVNFAAERPYALAASESNIVIVPGAAAGEIGIPDPIADPIVDILGTTGQQFVNNVGDAETWPRFRLNGPITNPQILNNATGETVNLNYQLAAGDWLDIYPELGRILLNGTGDRYSAFNASTSTWWKLQAGNNDVRLLAAAYSAPAQLTVFWRHAWQ